MGFNEIVFGGMAVIGILFFCMSAAIGPAHRSAIEATRFAGIFLRDEDEDASSSVNADGQATAGSAVFFV